MRRFADEVLRPRRAGRRRRCRRRPTRSCSRARARAGGAVDPGSARRRRDGAIVGDQRAHRRGARAGRHGPRDGDPVAARGRPGHRRVGNRRAAGALPASLPGRPLRAGVARGPRAPAALRPHAAARGRRARRRRRMEAVGREGARSPRDDRRSSSSSRSTCAASARGSSWSSAARRGFTSRASRRWAFAARRWGACASKEPVVPEDALLGEVSGDGAAQMGALVDRARIAWGAMAVGTAQAVLDYVIPYCNERKAFGEPISEPPGRRVPHRRHRHRARGHAPPRAPRGEPHRSRARPPRGPRRSPGCSARARA